MPMPTPRRLAAALLAILLALATWLALRPPDGAPASLGWDKLDHALGFAVLMVTAMAASGGRRALGVGLALLGYGGAIELLQTLVPGRHAEWADLGADALGIAAGAALSRLGAGRSIR